MSKVEIIKHPVQKVSQNLKQSAWMAVLESLAMIVVGILLIVWPDAAIKAIAYIVGIFFIIKGAYQVINYFVVKGQNDFFNNGLLFGVISILVGITALLIGEEIANIFRIVVGVWMIYESLVRINTAIKLHAAQIEAWKYALILALTMLLLGVFITFYNGAFITLVGWIMVISGIVGIVGDAVFIQYVNIVADKLTGSSK